MWNRPEMNMTEMTLELRIRPLVQTVVQKMLLQESDVRDAIDSAVEAAVTSFDWRGQLQDEVNRVIKEEVTRVSSQLVHSIFWDDEFKGHFRKAIANALQKE